MLLNGDSAYSFKRLGFLTLFSSSSIFRLPINAITCLQTACLGSWFVSYFLCMEGKGGNLRKKKKNKTGQKNTLQTPFPLQHGLSLTLCRCGAWSFSLSFSAGEELGSPWHQRGFLSSAHVSVVLGKLTTKTRYTPGADYRRKLFARNNSTAFLHLGVLP